MAKEPFGIWVEFKRLEVVVEVSDVLVVLLWDVCLDSGEVKFSCVQMVASSCSAMIFSLSMFIFF